MFFIRRLSLLSRVKISFVLCHHESHINCSVDLLITLVDVVLSIRSLLSWINYFVNTHKKKAKKIESPLFYWTKSQLRMKLILIAFAGKFNAEFRRCVKRFSIFNFILRFLM